MICSGRNFKDAVGISQTRESDPIIYRTLTAVTAANQLDPARPSREYDCMFIYGKMSSDAIAVASYLASQPDRLCGTAEISEARNLSRPLAAKLLTRLATAGIVEGRPGPNGGYKLARGADEITLDQIVELFEQTGTISFCPFGIDYCGPDNPRCPLHDQLVGLAEDGQRFLASTRLSIFSPE